MVRIITPPRPGEPTAVEQMQAAAATAGGGDKDNRSQPSKKLPTDRIKFQSQLDIIRAFGVTSQGGSKPTNYREVAKVVNLNPNTVSLMSTFLNENGFWERSGTDVMPVKSVIDFAQAHSWSPETAARKLAPLIKKTWFGERLVTRLAFRPMSEDDAIAELAQMVGATPDYKSQVAFLIDYVVAAGLVRREGGQLMLGEEVGVNSSETASMTPERGAPMPDTREDGPSRSSAVSTGFMTTEGRVQFHVSINVSMQEMSTWTPDRITAFFSGLAQVLAAKKGTEEIR